MFEKLKEKTSSLFLNKELNDIFNHCFVNTIDTTLSIDKTGYFVITGDIPAMWLRDSCMQVLHYLYYINDVEVQKLIKGVLKTQFRQICIDSYANAFMHDENQISEWDGKIQTDYLPKIVWERKYELDSLCYPLFLCAKYFEQTKDLNIFDDLFYKAFDRVIETVKIEREHSTRSTYYFCRPPKEDVGRNTNKNGDKGLVWSGFRPSDDACEYNFHIPDNMFLVSVLYKFKDIFLVLKDENRRDMCDKLIKELRFLIDKYGVVNIPDLGKVYVSETDCLGHFHINDDANVPSLLSIPFRISVRC